MKAKIKMETTNVKIFLNDCEFPQKHIQSIDIQGKAGEMPILTLGLRPHEIEVEVVGGKLRCKRCDTPFEREHNSFLIELIYCNKCLGNTSVAE